MTGVFLLVAAPPAGLRGHHDARGRGRASCSLPAERTFFISAGPFLPRCPFVYIAVAHRAYRARRIFSFLDPWADPQGAGHQIIQSFLAFGSGGVFGRGLGEGRQKLLFLPERHSDFIYAVIGEELGLIGALVVLVLFLIILWRGRADRARRGRSRSAGMLALGITLLICVQAMINMAVVTGLLPDQGHRASARELRRLVAGDHAGGAGGAVEYFEGDDMKRQRNDEGTRDAEETQNGFTMHQSICKD